MVFVVEVDSMYHTQSCNITTPDIDVYNFVFYSPVDFDVHGELLNDAFFGDFWSRVSKRTCAYPTINVYHRKQNKNEKKKNEEKN